jgi:integrase
MSIKLRYRKLNTGRWQILLDDYTKGAPGRRGSHSREIRATGYMFSKDFLPEKDRPPNYRLSQKDRETELIVQRLLEQERKEFDARVIGEATPNQFRKHSFLQYMEELIETRSMKQNTKRSWRQALGRFKEFLRERNPNIKPEEIDIFFGEITGELLKKFRSYLLEHLKSPNSAIAYMARIKTALKEAVRDGRIGKNPGEDISIKSRKSERVHLTLEEIKKLVATKPTNENTGNAFLFACATGLRISDIRALKWTDITDGYITYRQEKTGEPNTLPLSPNAIAIIERQRQIATGETVFQLRSTPAIDGQLLTWAKAAGIRKISFHIGRHTFAVLSIENDMPIYKLKGLLGHQSIRSTEVYAKITDQAKKAAIPLMPTW